MKLSCRARFALVIACVSLNAATLFAQSISVRFTLSPTTSGGVQAPTAPGIFNRVKATLNGNPAELVSDCQSDSSYCDPGSPNYDPSVRCCTCSMPTAVQQITTLQCGVPYTLSVTGRTCGTGVTLTFSQINSISAASTGYILEIRDQNVSPNTQYDKYDIKNITVSSGQNKTWTIMVKPKEVFFTPDTLVPDGKSLTWARLAFTNGTGSWFTNNPQWSIVDDPLGCTIDPVAGWIRVGTEPGEITVMATDSGSSRKATGVLRLGCATCDASCGPGQGRVANTTYAFSVGLGASGCLGTWSGSLRMRLTSASADLTTPAGLTFSNMTPEVIRDIGRPGINQIKTAQLFVNVTNTVPDPNPNAEYEIRVYWPENSGSKAGGLYQPTGSPFKVWRVTRTAADYTQFRIVEDPAGVNLSNNFTWIAGDSAWTLNRTGVSQERKMVQDNLPPVAPREVSRRSETNEVSTPGNPAIGSRLVRTYATLSLNGGALQRTNVLVEERLDGRKADGSGANADQVTSYFYAATATADGHEKLQRVIRSDGSWEHYIYDASNRIATAYSPWLDSTPPADIDTAPTAVPHRETVYDYTLLPGDTRTDDQAAPRRTDKLVQPTSSPPPQLVSRTYAQLTLDTNSSPLLEIRKDIGARNVTATWDDTNNPVTIIRTLASGPFKGAVHSSDRPDGTRAIRSYTATSQDASDGAAGTGFTVTDGRRTLTTKTARGYVQTNEVYDILTGKKLVSDVWSAPGTNDPQGRFTLLTHLDGTTETYTYDCCNLAQVTDRDGATTAFTPDALKRPWKTTVYYSANLVNGIETRNTFDAQGNVTRITRVGADSTSIDVLPLREYDRAGRVIREQNALGGYTTIAEGTTANGGRKVTTIYPDGGTRIEEHYRDGRLAKVYGTAVREPAQYEYLLSASGELVTKETKVDATWAPTSEWTKTYTDFLGREYKTVYADATTGDDSDNPYSQRFFKDNGQLWKERNLDGVLTVSIFNARGEIEYTMVGQKTEPTTPPTAPDTSGEHRITRVERLVGSYTDGIVYDTLLTRITEWTNLNSANTIVSSETHTSLDGLREWSVACPNDSFKQVVKTVTQYGGAGARTVTTTYPDNSYQISLFAYGRPSSVTRYPSSGAAISQTTYQHDPHGRLWTSTDARNGTTTFYYNSADQISSVTSPPPTNGQPAQTRSIAYDSMGRPTQVTEPDGGLVYTRYYSNGLVKLAWGARTVPSGYEFDGQGRVTKLYTWQAFAAPDPGVPNPPFPSGAVATLWHYDHYRGWPQDKRYADNTGPDYTYTPGGLPKTRSWWRSVPGNPAARITATNTYDFEAGGSNPNRKAGYLARIEYNDGTAGVTFDYDRRGRGRTITQGSGGATITTTLAWHPAGPLDSEVYSGSFLDTLSVVVDNVDAVNLLRRESLEARKAGVALGGTVAYGYDSAWRLQTVANGAFSVTYGYVANSDLLATNTFKQGSTPRLTTTRQFDFLNRVTSILHGALPVGSSYAYNQANQRTSRGEANGAYWIFGYDELGQVGSGKKYSSSGQPVAGQHFEYSFDWIGNRVSTSAGGDERGQGLRSSTYTPTNLNQYTQRTVPTWVSIQGEASSNTTVTVNLQPTKRQGDYYWTELWFNNSTGAVYQSITNVAALRRTNQPDVVSTVVGSLFQPKTPELFLHDADGNLTNDGRWIITWDAENRASSFTSLATAPSASRQKVDCAYDYRWRRIQKIVSTWNGSTYVPQSTNRFLYDGWNLVAVLNGTNGLVSSFMWGRDVSGTLEGAGGVGGLISMTVHQGSYAGTYFYCYDGNGNVVALVNTADGTVAAQYEYGPFGELLRATGPLAFVNPFRFSTKFQDDETGFLYCGYRYYNPSTGRWLSRDPIEEDGGPNSYAFVYNNPQRFVDPLGLRIYIIAPPVGGLDYTHFDDYVLNGFQRIVGDCAKLRKAPIIREVETGFFFWKKTQTRLVGWQIYHADEKLNCVCSPCWKYLKGALGDNLPKKDIYIHRGNQLDNAFEASDTVFINERLDIHLPTLDRSGNVVRENTPFDVVLWHEAIGHGYRDLTHPNKKWNRQNGGGQDPTILEENNARNCLRLLGIQINDRVPTYYGWKK